MPPQDSSSNEKVYRFISDPGHKENLSGRVRAACVTCRRKKIKCSGEIPCGTCEEKGIACEGLTERKRPRKTIEHQQSQDPSSQRRRSSCSTTHSKTGAQFSEQTSLDIDFSSTCKATNSSTRPTANLQRLGTISSNDSGYSSGIQSGQDCLGSPMTHLDTTFFLGSGKRKESGSNYDNSTEISPATTKPPDWSFMTQHEHTNYCRTEKAESDTPRTTQVASPLPAASIDSMGWTDPRDRSSWRQDCEQSGPAAADLIYAARALEEQAQSLRRLASQHDVETVDNIRRHTIPFPQSSTSEGLPQYPPQAPGAYDDLSLLLADHPSGNDATSTKDDFVSCWDMYTNVSNPMDLQPYSASTLQPGEMSAISGIASTDQLWCRELSGSSMSAIARSGEGHIGSPTLNVSSAEMGEPRRGQRLQPEDLFGQLYHWPK